MPDREDLVRAFFALWPDKSLASDLNGAARAMHQILGGRSTRADGLHMTLVFLGQVPRERLGELTAMAAALQAPAFVLTLDRTECWRHNRIACLTATRTPAALATLVDGLTLGATKAGLKLEDRAFRPHVTLGRKVKCGETWPDLAPLEWCAREFVLVESRPGEGGSHYRALGRFPLQG